jgi:hypothetical protein
VLQADALPREPYAEPGKRRINVGGSSPSTIAFCSTCVLVAMTKTTSRSANMLWLVARQVDAAFAALV